MITRPLDWCSAKLFGLVHGNNLVYNTCWEDPALDRVALDLKPHDNVMMITSAGCNALDYALTRPNHIYAVDVNPRQNALLELKIAGIKTLDFDTFFELFGKGRLESFSETYQKKLRPVLSAPARDYWDRHTNYFTGTIGRPTFYYRGTSGAIARMFNYYIDLCGVRRPVESMFAADSLDDQRDIYHRLVKEAFWTKFVKWAVSWDATLSMVGVPAPQRQQIEKTYAGGMSRFVEDCIESVFTRLSLKNNYFWWLYFKGEYTHERCPEYLKEENFHKLKDGLVDRISTHTSTILNFLSDCSEPISRYVLLDHMDWLSTYHLPVLEAEWQAILDRAAPSTRLIWRSGALRTDFVDPIEVRSNGMTRKVGDLLSYNRELAAELHVRDRTHTYGSFYIADLAGNA